LRLVASLKYDFRPFRLDDAPIACFEQGVRWFMGKGIACDSLFLREALFADVDLVVHAIKRTGDAYVANKADRSFAIIAEGSPRTVK
jgi:hypothetical protein